MGVKQHLVGLQKIGPDDKGEAVRQLEVRHLQFGALAAEDRPVLAPIELKPRPLVCCSRCRSAFQSRTKAATRL